MLTAVTEESPARLPALETSVFLLLQPMLTTTWAWLIFSELLSATQIAGMILVLSAPSALDFVKSPLPAHFPADQSRR